MARGKLFESWSFKMQMPEPFDDPQYSGGKDFGLSQYNSAGTLKKASLHAPSLRALLAYARLVNASEQGQSTENLGAIGHQNDNYRIAEYRSNGKTDCVVFNPTTGKFIASRFEDGSDAPKGYSLGIGAGTGSALIFALMPILEKDDEFRDRFAEFKEEMRLGWPDMDAALETALTLCDNIYRRVENWQNVGSASVKLAVPTTGNISTLSKLAIDNGNYAPNGTLYGEFTIIKMGGSPAQQAKVYSLKDFVGNYELSPRQLTVREDAMVPKLPDWYIIPHEVVRVCEHAKATSGSSQPMRNFLFRGEAGTGKTMGAQAIAAGLHLPYTLMTCSANTEISDLIGQFIPDTGSAKSAGGSPTDSLPKISDIMMYPPSVYEELTGVYDDNKTEDDVLEKLVEIAAERLAQKEERHGQTIRYVDTPLMEAIRYGYVCELQEPTCIANPGVLVGLNSLLDNCQSITLPTGERVQRHPDTVIIVTTNSEYAGCKDVNRATRSVLKRCSTN